MNIDCIAIISNPYAGQGRERVLELTSQAFKCLQPQVSKILVGPGDMGESVCQGNKIEVVGENSAQNREDTIKTARLMTEKGAELFVIISGDGTYNDALEGMKSLGATLPIFGIAAGRFNVSDKRATNPFVSLLGDFKPFSIKDLLVEDVMGLVCRINDKIVSYGFFWAAIANVVAYTDAKGNLTTIDAAQYIDGKIVPLLHPTPIANQESQITLLSDKLGEIELASGSNICMPTVAPLVPEITHIVAGGFGMTAKEMGFDGVAHYYLNVQIGFLPTPEFFPVETKSLAFFAGDKIRYTGMNDGSVFQMDSSAICKLNSDDILTVEVVLNLGKKAIVK